MTDLNTTFTKLLRKHGHSVTRTRKILFEAFQNREPQSMRELIAACDSKVDRASVYRTVELFEKLGVVQRLQIGWKHKLELSDTFNHHHHHLTCLRCGKVITLPENTQIEKQLQALAQNHRFLTQDHQLEIRGLCANCHN